MDLMDTICPISYVAPLHILPNKNQVPIQKIQIWLLTSDLPLSGVSEITLMTVPWEHQNILTGGVHAHQRGS